MLVYFKENFIVAVYNHVSVLYHFVVIFASAMYQAVSASIMYSVLCYVC